MGSSANRCERYAAGLGGFDERVQPRARRRTSDRLAEEPTDVKSRELLHAVRAFADASFNVKQTARRLGLRANTV